MMKDRPKIEAVIQTQKQEKNLRNYRVLQAMRLIRREYMKNIVADSCSEAESNSEYGEERTITSEEMSIGQPLKVRVAENRLKEVTVKQIYENF